MEMKVPSGAGTTLLGREGECSTLGNMDQDGHGLSILTFSDHKNILLVHGGDDNRGQEEVIKKLLLGRSNSELPWDHLL